MRVGKRLLNASTDDFVFSSGYSAFLRCLWLACLIALAITTAYEAAYACMRSLQVFLYVGIATSALGVLLDGSLCFFSSRGTLADDSARRPVPHLLIARSLYTLADGAVAGYGVASAVSASSSCSSVGLEESVRVLVALALLAAALSLAASLGLALAITAAWVLGLTGSKAQEAASTAEALVRLAAVWTARCARCSFLCRGVGSSLPAPWEAVGAALATAFAPVELLHLTASDVWAGLLLLRQEQLDEQEVRVALWRGERESTLLQSTPVVAPRNPLHAAIASLTAHYAGRAQGRSALSSLLTSSVPLDPTRQPLHRSLVREAAHYAHWARAAYGMPLYCLQYPGTACCRVAAAAAGEACHTCCSSGGSAGKGSDPYARAHYQKSSSSGSSAGRVEPPSNPCGSSSAVLKHVLREEARRVLRTAARSTGGGLPFQASDLLHASHMNAFFNVPWFLAVDRSGDGVGAGVGAGSGSGGGQGQGQGQEKGKPKALVLVIRGTLSPDDVLTDGLAVPLPLSRDPECDLLLQALARGGTDRAPVDSRVGTGADAAWPVEEEEEDRGRLPLTAEDCYVHAGFWQAGRQLRDELLSKGLLKAAARGVYGSPGPWGQGQGAGGEEGGEEWGVLLPLPQPGVAQASLQALLHTGDDPTPSPSTHGQGRVGAGKDRRPRGLSSEALAGPSSLPALARAAGAGGIGGSGGSAVQDLPTASAPAGRARGGGGQPTQAQHLPPVTGPAAAGGGVARERNEEEAEGTLPLVLVGHSLGAGIVAMLALQLLPWYPGLRAYALSAPGGTLSPALAAAVEPWVTSVVLGKDLVPRLSMASVEALMTRSVQALGRARVGKGRVTCMARQDVAARYIPLCPSSRACRGRVGGRGVGEEEARVRPRSAALTTPPWLPVPAHTPLGRAIHALGLGAGGREQEEGERGESTDGAAGSFTGIAPSPLAPHGPGRAGSGGPWRVGFHRGTPSTLHWPVSPPGVPASALQALQFRRALLSRPMRAPGRLLHMVRVGRVAADAVSVAGEYCGAVLAALLCLLLQAGGCGWVVQRVHAGKGEAGVEAGVEGEGLRQVHVHGARAGGACGGCCAQLLCCSRRTRGVYEGRWVSRGALAREGIVVSASCVADHLPHRVAHVLCRLVETGRSY